MSTKTATFGAGCFWGVEADFRKLDGVVDTAVGYMGGTVENPTYEQVCRRVTGHAEVVQVEYDPSKISYSDLLGIFWSSHDPTQLDRQGPDIGSQYRSVIFFHDSEQESKANTSKAELESSGRLSSVVVTQIASAETFWRAEDYHQQYLEKKGLASCRIDL
jgi:peptide-methionine (S)-S-oxide reductase